MTTTTPLGRRETRDGAPLWRDGSGPRVAWQHALELSEADR